MQKNKVGLNWVWTRPACNVVLVQRGVGATWRWCARLRFVRTAMEHMTAAYYIVFHNSSMCVGTFRFLSSEYKPWILFGHCIMNERMM